MKKRFYPSYKTIAFFFLPCRLNPHHNEFLKYLVFSTDSNISILTPELAIAILALEETSPNGQEDIEGRIFHIYGGSITNTKRCKLRVIPLQHGYITSPIPRPPTTDQAHDGELLHSSH